MTCIITDDEQNSRESLRYIIKAMAPDVHIVAEAANTEEAKKFIEKLKPDILFLDINMPNQTGIEFLEENYPLPCHVIFTTAYDEHAIKAFRLNAIDYLLKPINPDDLLTAIEKVKRFSMFIATGSNCQCKKPSTRNEPAHGYSDHGRHLFHYGIGYYLARKCTRFVHKNQTGRK
jgi:DNA-binding LytR/AlgR family response regulator